MADARPTEARPDATQGGARGEGRPDLAADEPPDYARDLVATVDAAATSLAALPDAVTTWRPSARTWSAKEIIGHLIDSAANNHQRFVRAPSQSDLVFGGYDQDEWVRVQQYDRVAWRDLLALWRGYNHHIAHVMASVPAAVRLRVHTRHNLDRIGWRPFPADAPATLDDLMRDYVGHLHHHLGQVRDRVRFAPENARAGHAGVTGTGAGNADGDLTSHPGRP